ncbi:MAG: zinc ribbon domain-containing protein [Candidatus Methylomirabilia bacterium]
MQCPRCQHDNLADATFCQEGGSQLEATCPSCGGANQPNAKFCRKCGQRLQAEGAQPGAAPEFGSPETYTPKHRLLGEAAARRRRS